jgi:putative adhesin
MARPSNRITSNPTLQEHTEMPTFDTPERITATIDIALGDVRIRAADVSATHVDVRPSDTSRDDDVAAAGSTRVEYANGQLLVKGPKPRWMSGRSGGSLDVTIELPAGSHVRGSGHAADFRCDGRLGQCRITIGIGEIRLDRADAPSLKSGIGDISLERATGHSEVTTGSGEVRVRELDGSAALKNSNGDTWVGVAGGDVRINAANGSINVDLARASIVAKSANGDVRVREVVRGSVVLETRLGDLEVGIREGTAAWLDVSATAGTVHNMLDASDAPEPSTETVDVRARTSVGEIAIRRAETADHEQATSTETR